MGVCIKDKIQEKVFNVLKEYNEEAEFFVSVEAACLADKICEALDITWDDSHVIGAVVVVQMPEGE